MKRSMTFVVPAVLAIACVTGPAIAVGPDVGTTVLVKSSVSVEAGAEQRPLRKGNVVHQDEVIVTRSASSAEIELRDKTKLAVGPDARIVLDKFVYDAGAEPGAISVNLSKGAFRFITGLSPKASYEIKTPTATMGVRGTVFDVFVAESGETVVLLHEGAVDVCGQPGECRRHDRIGHLVHVSLQRVLSAPLRWDGSLVGGLAFARAFPFVGKRLVIDPVRRVAAAGVSAGARVGKAITDPIKALPRLKSPF